MTHALAFALIAGPLVAQQPVANTMSVEPGTRIRAWGSASTLPVTGTLVSTSGSSLRIAHDRDTADVQNVTRIQVVNGRRGHALAGALVGAVAVGGTLAIAGAASCPSNNCIPGAGVAAGILGVGGAAVGALVGGIVGAVIHTDRWQDVPLTRAASRVNLRLVPSGLRGRPGLAAAIGVGIG